MTTRAEFISSVRLELQDTATQPIWNTTLLLNYARIGIVTLSTDFLLMRRVTLAAVAGQTEYTIPTSLVVVGPAKIKAVEYPPGTPVPMGVTSAGNWYSALDDANTQAWRYWYSPPDTQVLSFRLPLESNGIIMVQASTYYELGTTDASVINVPEWLEAPLRWRVCEQAHGWLERVRLKRSGQNILRQVSNEADYYRNLYTGFQRQWNASSITISTLTT